MKLSDENLRILFREEKVTPRSPCPTEADLLSAASGNLPNAARDAITEHLTTCSGCVAEYQTLRDLKLWARDEAANIGASTAIKTPRTNRLAWLLKPQYAATAVVLLLLILIPFLILRERSASNFETGSVRGTGSITMNSEPADGALLDQSPERLSWSSDFPAYGYKVTLYDFESTLLWESGFTKNTSFQIPEDIRSTLRPGQVYYWRVVFLNGSPRQSKLLKFRLNVNAK